jgi:hypothetical protein
MPFHIVAGIDSAVVVEKAVVPLVAVAAVAAVQITTNVG